MLYDVPLIAANFCQPCGGTRTQHDRIRHRSPTDMVRTRQPTIERARTAVEGEIELVSTEREAFEGFLDRLRDVATTGTETVSRSGGPTTLVATRSAPSEGLEAVRTAYRETVMAVPHYDEEYGDTLAESMAAEFGTVLAGHVADGEVLTPVLSDALVEASERARNNRTDFLRHLRQERESLRDIETDLNGIEARVDELEPQISSASTSAQLADIDDTLDELERRCTDLANRRQRTIHDRSTREISGVDDRSLLRYLYADMETITPALVDIAACLDAIRYQRERCLR